MPGNSGSDPDRRTVFPGISDGAYPREQKCAIGNSAQSDGGEGHSSLCLLSERQQKPAGGSHPEESWILPCDRSGRNHILDRQKRVRTVVSQREQCKKDCKRRILRCTRGSSGKCIYGSGESSQGRGHIIPLSSSVPLRRTGSSDCSIDRSSSGKKADPLY